MKLVGTIQSVEVTNKTGGRISMGKFALSHNHTKVIETISFSETVLSSLEKWHSVGKVDLKKVDVVEVDDKESSNTVQKETIKNDKGEKREHTVFDPETAEKERAIKVDEKLNSGKSIEVGDLDKSLAINFLEQHWKKIEKELQEHTSVERLEFYLTVANEIGMSGNKKHELIEDRILELKK